MSITNFAPGVHYVGVNDRTTEFFESLWLIPLGVSYNSYLVEGQKTALIDTVDINSYYQFLDNVKAVLGDKPLDYIIISHMEHDHSGAISLLRQQYPHVTIVGNEKTACMLKGFFGIEEGVQVIKDGDTVDLGGKKLKFFLTPMLHWPETMMTYVEEEGILFSGDAFGCFGALNGAVVDDDMDTSMHWMEMYRYYASIVAKYGVSVKNAMKKISGIDVKYICSTHGPVWHDEIAKAIDIYTALAEWEAQKGVVIAYSSMHGNTTVAAEILARRLAENGVKNVVLQNLANSDISYVLMNIARFKGIAIGGPTYNTELNPRISLLLQAMKNRNVQNRVVGCFGSYSWSPGVTKKMTAGLECLKVELLEPVEFKHAVKPADVEALHAMADALAAKL